VSIKPSISPALRDIDGLAVIGRSKHALMGIRYEDGEGGDAAAAAAAAAQADAAAKGADAPWTKDNFDPERAQRLFENLKGDVVAEKSKREQAIKDAVAQAQKDIVAQIASALGGGEQPETDPEKLRTKVTDLSSQIAAKDTDLSAAQAAVKAGQLSTQVAILAHGLGGSPKLLLANEAFKNSIASVEPTDEAAIMAAITAAIQANAALKATPSSSGGGEHQGGQTQALHAQLAAAEKANDYPLVISLKRQIARLTSTP
jgi:hypothetical protein